jgi:hypothetical protein
MYYAASMKICINGWGCLCYFETWLRNFKFGVRLSWRNFETIFLKLENIEFLFKFFFKGAEILYRAQHFNCEWDFDEQNKKIV